MNEETQVSIAVSIDVPSIPAMTGKTVARTELPVALLPELNRKLVWDGSPHSYDQSPNG